MTYRPDPAIVSNLSKVPNTAVLVVKLNEHIAARWILFRSCIHLCLASFQDLVSLLEYHFSGKLSREIYARDQPAARRAGRNIVQGAPWNGIKEPPETNSDRKNLSGYRCSNSNQSHFSYHLGSQQFLFSERIESISVYAIVGRLILITPVLIWL